jgi:hypothetical protein
VAEEAYQAELRVFCKRILEIRSRLDFEIGSRGWCYVLEGERVINKGEFDECERLIASCRKRGDLPIDICAEDSKRAADGIEELDNLDVDDEADQIVESVRYAHINYTPVSFWEDLNIYIEIAVEKSDLKSLFSRVASEFHIVIQNIGGWADIRGRAGMMHRFGEWERRGEQPVLLYCGDHDPGGLQISDFLRENLNDLAKAVGWSPDDLVIDRFGLDYDFIEANDLVWIDNLETSSGGNLADPRHRDHNKPYVQNYLMRFGARKVEANALVAAPEAGRALCRQAILRYVPETAITDYNRKLAALRGQLQQAVIDRMAAP